MTEFSIEWNNLPKGLKLDSITVICNENKGNENEDNPNINKEFEDAVYCAFGLLPKVLGLDPTKIPGGVYYKKEETK